MPPLPAEQVTPTLPFVASNPMSTLSARSVSRRLDRPGPIGPAVTQIAETQPGGGPPAARLLASAGMTRAGTRAFRPTGARTVDEILRRLGALWQAPALTDIPVVLNPHLSRTLGRLVLAVKAGPTHPAPHGPEWRELMALAGYTDATGAHWACHRRTGQSPQQRQKHKQQQQPTPRTQPAIACDHWCPVCQSSRQARRPVKAWRCAACVAAGLAGKLEITRRARRPKRSP